MATLDAIHTASQHHAPMESQPTARLIANFGIEGDRCAREGRNGQILIMPAEVLDRLEIFPGDVRENLTTRGIEIMKLQPGARIRVGAALLEVVKPATPCERMDEVRYGLREELAGQRGMLCRIISGGVVKVGDRVGVETM